MTNNQSQQQERREAPETVNTPLRIEGWHSSLTERGWYIRDAANRIVATIHFEEDEEPTRKAFDEGNALARTFVTAINSLLQQPTSSERCGECDRLLRSWLVCMKGPRPQDWQNIVVNLIEDTEDHLIAATGTGEGEQREGSLTRAEFDELRELQKQYELSGLGDRPHSIAAEKLQRLMELESKVRRFNATPPAPSAAGDDTDLIDATITKTAPPPAPWQIRLYDRADGVRDHYCVGRFNPTGYHEFWNKDQFCSAGEVFIGRPAALAKARELSAASAPSPTLSISKELHDQTRGFWPEPGQEATEDESTQKGKGK